MEDWTQKGHENWLKNQDVRKKRENSDLEFMRRQDERHKARFKIL